MPTYRALTIHQPWASLIIQGHKQVENRPWQTDYRGTIAIHAAASRNSLIDGRYTALMQGIKLPPDDQLVYAAIIGLVDLVDIVRYPDIPGELINGFASGPFCWILKNPRPIKHPIPYRGQLKFFNVEI